jgi:MFS family permease
VLTITFIASEALAVVTVMPVVARSLGGLHLYGWVFSAFMLGSLVGIVAAGRAADRIGPARPYIAGLVLFGSGLAVAGSAPSMIVLIVGRALQGIGAGVVPAVAYVAIGRTLPEGLQARMMAVLSTAWVVPGLVGPAVSAVVAAQFGWRWVFLGLIPLVGVAGVMALPALMRLGPPAAQSGDEHRLIDGLGTAVGAGLVLGGLSAANLLLGAVLVAAGLTVGLPSLRRILPAGTLTARSGLPATILSRGLVTFAFFGADAFVTLTVTEARHRSTGFASLAVTAATMTWTAGSWLQAHMTTRWPPRRLVRIGLTFIVIGIGGMVLATRSQLPAATAIAAWGIGGFGMGVAYAPITLMMLREAPPGREGWASASLNLADALGIALGAGVGGAALAATSSAGWSVSGGVTAAFAVAAVGGVVALLVSARLPSADVTFSSTEAAREPA